MYLHIDPKNKKATLMKGDETEVATISFESYGVVEQFKETSSLLDLVFYCNDLNMHMTIRDYLKKLLLTLWEREDCFSGKRPFGNSDWKYDIYGALVKEKIINGTLDEEECLEEFDYEKAEEILTELINDLR